MMYMPSIFGENLMDDFFSDFDRGFFTRPAIGKKGQQLMKTDIHENESGYDLDIELPGYKKDELKLVLDHGYLNITAEKNTSEEKKDENGRLIRQERFCGSMRRSFYVGEEMKEEDIKARFEDGILKLSIPKKEAVKEVPEQKVIAIEG